MAGTNSYSTMNKKISEKNNDGVSPVIATIILVAITVIMCGLFAAFAMAYVNELDERSNEILKIEFTNSNSSNNYASIVTLKNIGNDLLVNSDYKPVFYINGNPFSTPDLISLKKSEYVNHNSGGVGPLGIYGDGPDGDVWLPGDLGYIDLTNEKIKQGYVVQVDIIRKSDGKLFSRSVRVHN